MKEDVALDYPVLEAVETFITDYEIERDKPMPNKVHAIVQTRLARWLGNQYDNRFDIATELSLDTPGKPSTPDVCILEKAPLNFFDDSPREAFPPLTAIEIASPSQGFSIFKAKAQRYFDFGVRSYWLVQPNLRTIYVFSGPQTFDAFLTGDVVKDPAVQVEMPMDAVFS